MTDQIEEIEAALAEIAGRPQPYYMPQGGRFWPWAHWLRYLLNCVRELEKSASDNHEEAMDWHLGLVGMTRERDGLLAELEEARATIDEQKRTIASLLPPGETATEWSVHLARLEAEVERLTAALQEIAGHGCGIIPFIDGKPSNCIDFGTERDDWCWSCLAQEALNHGSEDG